MVLLASSARRWGDCKWRCGRWEGWGIIGRMDRRHVRLWTRTSVVVGIAIGVLVLAFAALLVLRVREEAFRMQCASNLRELGVATHNYHNDFNFLPPGTRPNPALPPEKRLSWHTQVWFYIRGGMKPDLDESLAWDDPKNAQARLWERTGGPDSWVVNDYDWPMFRCPAAGKPPQGERPSPTHYVGIAGLGPDAASLPLNDPRIGILGYHRKCTLRMLTEGDGASHTMMLAETVTNPGPWTAGGTSTVRGLLPGSPYVGWEGQFSNRHRCERFGGNATNIVFADCAIRSVSGNIDAKIFEAWATIKGGERFTSSDY